MISTLRHSFQVHILAPCWDNVEPFRSTLKGASITHPVVKKKPRQYYVQICIINRYTVNPTVPCIIHGTVISARLLFRVQRKSLRFVYVCQMGIFVQILVFHMAIVGNDWQEWFRSRNFADDTLVDYQADIVRRRLRPTVIMSKHSLDVSKKKVSQTDMEPMRYVHNMKISHWKQLLNWIN